MSWVPKEKGETYCSPGCGRGCTKAEYSKAAEDAAKLATQLGSGWEPKTWENGGWHGKAVKTDRRTGCFIAVYIQKDSYWVDARLPEQICAHAAEPAYGVELVLSKARRDLELAKQALENLS